MRLQVSFLLVMLSFVLNSVMLMLQVFSSFTTEIITFSTTFYINYIVVAFFGLPLIAYGLHRLLLHFDVNLPLFIIIYVYKI